ncbi:MAG TPA: 7-cyano-7-deazaguanine synthase [Candidatus Elarobacter sp.]
MKTALLLSGGVDSIALAWWLRPSLAVTINYGQRPFEGESRAASAVCDALQIDHRIVAVDASRYGSGDLSDRAALAVAPVSDWWPYRNQFIATVAAMATIDEDVDALAFGTVASDAQHVDGSAAFIESLDRLISMQEGAMHVVAPALRLSSLELIEASGVPLDILRFAHSCHAAAVACGDCRGCNKYLDIFEALRGSS